MSGPLFLHRQPMAPLNEGSRLTPGAASIPSDGGEAKLIILAEQPGDDARASTVSIPAQRTPVNQRTSASFRFRSERLHTDHQTGTLRKVLIGRHEKLTP
jgi:hypothetical protein